MTTLDSRPSVETPIQLIDARGPRFGAVLTTIVLAATLLTIPSFISLVLLGAQTIVFALGASHCDAGVIAQTLPDALEWTWKGYPR